MPDYNYFADPKRTLYDDEYRALLPLMKRAGVKTLWMLVYSSGKYEASPNEIKDAKRYLENEGFCVNAEILPVGHPGNSLNPEQDLDLRLPESWRYRELSDGTKDYFCACIEDVMISDNKEAVKFCRDAGFSVVFFDDDLRMGNHGDEIRGCFCPYCVAEFSSIIGKKVTASEIQRSCDLKDALSEQWIDYNCSKVTRFMAETALDGITTGIMIMHNGGRIHGIDVSAIKKAVPDCLFRVGEFHFDDNSFESDTDHKCEIESIRNHLAIIGDKKRCYSETTVFPPRALSPDNLVKKVELALSEGIDNIFLMSGTWVMTPPYWQALIDNEARLNILAKKG